MWRRFTLADIQLYAFAEFGKMVGQGMPEDLPNLQAWIARIAEQTQRRRPVCIRQTS